MADRRESGGGLVVAGGGEERDDEAGLYAGDSSVDPEPPCQLATPVLSPPADDEAEATPVTNPPPSPPRPREEDVTSWTTRTTHEQGAATVVEEKQTITPSSSPSASSSPVQEESPLIIKQTEEEEEAENEESILNNLQPEEEEEEGGSEYETNGIQSPSTTEKKTEFGDRDYTTQLLLNAAETEAGVLAITTVTTTTAATTKPTSVADLIAAAEEETTITTTITKAFSSSPAERTTTPPLHLPVETSEFDKTGTKPTFSPANTAALPAERNVSPSQLPAETRTECLPPIVTVSAAPQEESTVSGMERIMTTMAAELQIMQVEAAPSATQQLPQETTATTAATPVVEMKSAACKYRWGKVVPTSSKRVIFFCSAHPNEPVFLHWCPQPGAYYSEELHVPCGDYAGHVIVEGKTYPVEPFNVRSYTFEVDLFLKEDVIEDEVATSNSLAQELKFQQQQQQQGPVDTYRDISSSAFISPPPLKMDENGASDDSGIRHNSKYEELLRQQLQHKESLDSNLENEYASQKTEQLAGGSGSKRLTPVGDIDKEPFQDGYSSLPVLGDGTSAFDPSLLGRSLDRHTPQHTLSGSASDLRQDFEMDRHSVKSAELGSSASRHSFGDAAPAGDAGLPKPPSRAGSDYSAGLGSGHLTPRQDFESSGGARPGSGSLASMDRRIDDVLGGSGSRSVRQTLTREPIGDVLGTEAILTSPAQSLVSGSARQTPERDLGLLGSSRSTPQKETLSAALRGGSQERLYGSQEFTSLGEAHSLPGSRPLSQSGSRPGSRQGSVTGSQDRGSRQASRAQSLNSLTSEQELSQFLESSSSLAGAGKRSLTVTLDTHPDEASSLPPIMRDRDRPSSLPAHTTQSPIGADKRTYTPDNTWSPLAAGGMRDIVFQSELPPRGTSKSSLSSRASSRTVTPVSAAVDREESGKVRDLEETVATLRKLLSSREQEVHELKAQLQDVKDINLSLKTDLDHARSRRIPAGSDELQRQYEQLLQEKEILAGEVVKLRDRLESSRGTGVDSFSAHSSTTMQKRIGELEAHVRDLRHTNDSTAQKLLRSEKRVRELAEENDKLSSSKSHGQGLQDDRGGRYADRHSHVELQQLKEEVRTLRDRNYALQDDIIRMKDGKTDPSSSRTLDYRSSRDPLSRDLGGRAPLGMTSASAPLMTSSARGDEGVRQRPAAESSIHDYSRSKQLHISDPPCSPGRRLDRSYGSDSFPGVSARDPPQRSSLDRSFGSDQGVREGLRETSSYSRSRLEHGDREHSGERLKYRDFGSEDRDIRRTLNRYDLLRSRPDGEVAEKVHASDAGRYGTLSAEKLRSFDREHEQERGGQSKGTMSAERLRILEEAERNRERRAQAVASTAGHRTVSADNHISSKDDTRQRKSEGNHSDDSDSTAVLMSFDVKGDTFSSQRERGKSSAYSERSRLQDVYYDRASLAERDREQEKQRDREYRDMRGAGGHREVNGGGDDSDTATDILLSVEPGRMSASRTSPRHHHHRRHHRHSSIGDDASLSSLSDGDEPQDSLRRRSKSADTKGKKGSSSHYGQTTTTLRPASSTEMLVGSGSKTVMLSSGFRTVTPQPLATQHNRHAALQQQASLSSSLTQGLRPFAPRSPGDLRPEDVVKFSRQGGKLSQGTVKYVGNLPGRSDAYLGVELYKEEGKHDGTFEGIRYFKCKPSKGVFVAFNKVVMAWAPN